MLPSIPENTIRAARASYGKGNIYLRLGDQINGLLSQVQSNLLTLESDGYPCSVLAALSIVQYVEGLTDSELTQTLPGRVDLRYALHLPTPGPRFDPFTLCTFRQKILKDPQYQRLLKEVFDLLFPKLGPEGLKNAPSITVVVKSICLNTMRASVVEAMFHAIEALSANDFNWLRQVALPHWYERYSHSSWMLHSGLSARQKELTPDDLRGDIEYLLHAADQPNSRRINDVSEIKTLRRMWDQLLHYKPGDQCSYCFNNRFERRTLFNSTNNNLPSAG